MLASLVGLLAAAAVFAVIGSRLINLQSRDAARREFDRQAVALGQLLSKEAEAAARQNRVNARLSSLVGDLERFAGRHTRIYYAGLPFFPGSSAATGGLPRATDTEVLTIPDATLVRQRFARVDYRVPTTGEHLLATVVPVVIGHRPWGRVVVARPPDDLVEPFDALTRTLAATGIGLLVAAILSLYLARRATRPLRELERATAQVAAGNLRVEIPRGGPTDVARLGASFNRMVRGLARRDALARDFLMRVTHDLRTPLTAIHGHAAALSDGVVPADLTADSYRAIAAEAARLDGLVTDLLDLARLDAHQFTLAVERSEIGPVLRTAFQGLAPEAARRGVRYEMDIAELPPLVTDPARVSQIVANLLDNALRWTPRGGRVLLRARATAGGRVEVSVSDTGPGIAAGEGEAVFEPFRSTSTPDGRHGTGLGLAISRQLARALGGDVTASDDAAAGGRFTLTLADAPPGGGPPDGQATT